MPEITTIKSSLHWSYANLAMAHAAVSQKSSSYSTPHFMIRSKLFKGLSTGTMAIGSIVDDERLKMILPQTCSYCGSRTQKLSIDHLIPKALGGLDRAENLVWACRSCNSSKGSVDFMDWYNGKGVFPPLLLLRRYLKMAVYICEEAGVMDTLLNDAPQLPFSLQSIPHVFPKPNTLRLWCVPLDDL